MKRTLPRLILSLFYLLLIFACFLIKYSFPNKAMAIPLVYPNPGSFNATVSGTVGNFYLNIKGYVAPFASIVITSDGFYLRATTADQFGYFTISEVLIKSGFSSLCFDAVDIRRLGESYSCQHIPPAKAAVTLNGIFLPPTLGLSRSQIAAGSSTTAWGYSMPGARVTLYVNNQIYITHADASGYYQVVLKEVKAGEYQLFATANFKYKDSLEPTNKVKLRALSWWEQLLQWLIDLWKRFVQFLTSLSFGPLWLAIPIIILIIILILKLWPEHFTIIYQNKLVVFV